MDKTYEVYLRVYSAARSMTPAATFTMKNECQDERQVVAYALGVSDGKAEVVPQSQAKVADAISELLAPV